MSSLDLINLSLVTTAFMVIMLLFLILKDFTILFLAPLRIFIFMFPLLLTDRQGLCRFYIYPFKIHCSFATKHGRIHVLAEAGLP